LMTFSHRASRLVTISAGGLFLVLLSGFATTKPQSFKLSFLPTTPQPVVIGYEQPPQIASIRYGYEAPNFLERAINNLPRPSEAEGLMVQAEDLFQSGRRLYQQGDIAGARRQFDRSLDVLLSAPENLPDRPRLERKLDQLSDSIYRYDLEGL